MNRPNNRISSSWEKNMAVLFKEIPIEALKSTKIQDKSLQYLQTEVWFLVFFSQLYMPTFHMVVVKYGHSMTVKWSRH